MADVECPLEEGKKSDITLTLNGGDAIRVAGSCVAVHCGPGKHAMVELF
jgi:hypothetical protein